MSVILLTGPVEPPTEEVLKDFGDIVIAPNDDEETLCSLAGDAVGIVARGNSLITSAVIEAAPNLKVIGRSGIGFDSVDVAAATARGIPVVITPNGPTGAVAEGVMALLLAVIKRLAEFTDAVQAGEWSARLTTDVREIEGSTFGLIGLGRIGRRVAKLCQPFGATLLAADPYVSAEDARNAGVELVDLDTLIERSDYISLHTPLTDETTHLVDADFLKRCKPGVVIINVSRGPLVDLDALYEALESGHVDGAGLDVFEPEPINPDHPILHHPGVVSTPHGIALTRLCKRLVFEDMTYGMVAVFNGQRPDAVANPAVYEAETADAR
jgi:D-3-phosphoglycerate dehydrogenase